MKKLFLAIMPCMALPQIQEVLADPSSLSDAQAEFVEIADLSNSPWKDSVYLQIGERSFDLGLWDAQKPYLVIGPSALQDYLPPGTPLISPSSLSLVNSSEIPLKLYGPGGQLLDSATTPKAKSGISWKRNHSSWIPSTTPSAWGDLASPGWSGDSSQFAQIKWDSIHCNHDSLFVQIQRPQGDDWQMNVLWDPTLGSKATDTLSLLWTGNSQSLAFPGSLGSAQITLGKGSPLPGQTLTQTLKCPGTNLLISEIFAAPIHGGSEWLELHNSSSNPLNLCALSWQSAHSSGTFCNDTTLLKVGEFWIWSSDTSAFRSTYGPLRLKLGKPIAWPSLGNEGGILLLRGPGGSLLDSISYGPSAYNRSQSYALAWNPDSRPSPGYKLDSDSLRMQIKLSLRQIHRSQTLYLWTQDPLDMDWALFDLRGNQVDLWHCEQGSLCQHPAQSWPLGPLLLRGLNTEASWPIQVLP